MSESHRPLRFSHDAEQRTERWVQTVEENLETMASSQVLDLALHEPVLDLRQKAQTELGSRLDRMDELLSSTGE